MHITSPSKQDFKASTVCSTNFSKCFSCRQIFNFRLFCANGYFSNSRCASWYLIWILANPLAIFHLIRHFSIARISGHKCTITLWTKTFLPLKGKSNSFTSQCWQRGAGGGGGRGGDFPRLSWAWSPATPVIANKRKQDQKNFLAVQFPAF